MTTSKGFPVGAQWISAHAASGLGVGAPVRLQNLSGGVLHYAIGASAPNGEDALLYPAVEPYGYADIPFSNSATSNTLWVIQTGGQGFASLSVTSAQMFQTYDSANAKTGNAFKFSARVTNVAVAGTMRIGIKTGAFPVTVKMRELWQIGSTEVIYRAYDDSVYTGGTAVVPMNQGRHINRAAGFQIVLNPTVTTIGNQYLPDVSVMSNAPASSRLGTQVVGDETNLKPNTYHIWEAYNQGAGTASVITLNYLVYEGPLDLPL